MSIGDFFSRVGENISNAPPEAWFTLANALSGSKNVGQGLAQGISGFGQASQAANKKASLAEALKGMSGDMSPQQAMLLEKFPEIAIPQMAENVFKAPKAESQPSGVQEYEYAKAQGFPGSFLDFQLAQKKAGASSTTINNIPAEVGARLGLASGFLERYDDITKNLDGLGTVTGRAQLIFNTGKAAEVKRQIESGAEALIRQLTGAGKSREEAESYASRYLPNALDTAFDLKSKVKGLRYDLEHTASGIYKAKGGKYTPPPTGADNSDVDAILGLN